MAPLLTATTAPRRSRGTRRITLIAHLVSSLGWLGLDMVLLTLGTHAATHSGDRHTDYLTVRLLLNTLLLPLSLSSIGTGLLLMRLGPWLFRRDHWATAKLVISTAAAAAAWLALRPQADQAVAATARPGDPGSLFATLHSPGPTLIIAPTVACALYLTATVLGVVKPGRGRRRRRLNRVSQRDAAGNESGHDASPSRNHSHQERQS
ncbi:hypothetical protein ORV05_22825 [Amycolatopsis cynarae]|uniref:DUF2269 domain-containing protein n=1 Tax=Amycolatopsis cynarae TaxID=2995223 RepID=A0ABY7AV08_9PSEU|nr:hypothetical protein [Amycolatopsis sp. HUAS 11-8]WAL63814.1 hypothetical protein ORV05_22825 [Amycolatopsis sp. HUAS 11-8]